MKTCHICLLEKTTDDFEKNINCADGITNRCKNCRNIKLKVGYKKDIKKREAQRNRSLKYKFGIDLITYRTMVEQQDGRCVTCSRHYSSLSKPLVVDHNHETGRVRGLLCDYCNRLLGNYENKPSLFRAFEKYLINDEMEL